MTEHPNAALVRRLYGAFRTRDRPTLAALIADDAVWHVPGSTPISGTHRGSAAIFAYFQALGERSGGTFHAELVDAFGSDLHGVALATTTGQRAGRTYAGRYLLLMTIRRDRIAEAHLFNEDQTAFDAFWS
jgi:ketosteroid isomerase-like protein